LAAAVNIKLIPIMIILPLLIVTTDWKQLGRLVGGLAVGALPFLPAILVVPREFLRNVVSYTPGPDFWGVEGLAISATLNRRWADSARQFYDWYVQGYRPVLFGALIVVALLERFRPRLDNYQRCALFLAIFFILTPGFGMQYTAALAPLIFATSVAWGLRFATTAGLMLLVTYLYYKTNGPLLNSELSSRFPVLAAMIGILAWGILIQFVAQLLWKRRAARLHPDQAVLPAAGS
jgi:hypothetical protein